MTNSIAAKDVTSIIFACEAGMGSSLMGVSALKKKLNKADLKVKVVHTAARAIPNDANVVVVHKGLSELVKKNHPDAVVIVFSHFMNDPVFDQIVNLLKDDKELSSSS